MSKARSFASASTSLHPSLVFPVQVLAIAAYKRHKDPDSVFRGLLTSGGLSDSLPRVRHLSWFFVSEFHITLEVTLFSYFLALTPSVARGVIDAILISLVALMGKTLTGGFGSVLSRPNINVIMHRRNMGIAMVLSSVLIACLLVTPTKPGSVQRTEVLPVLP
ncbi:hypothetical protein V8E53_011510 [Lactarius tabidus]